MPFNVTYSKIKTFVNGGKIYPGDVDDALDDLGVQLASVNVAGGFNEGSNVRRGKCIVPGADTRTNTAYGLMPTPDLVPSVVIPTGSLLFVAYQATWQEAVSATARAAIFIGSNQLKAAVAGQATPVVQAASIGGTNVNTNYPLGSSPGGLASKQTVSDPEAAYTGDVSTGQIVGGGHDFTSSTDSVWGVVAVFGLSGTYDVSVRFKASSGSVSASDRSLWAWTQNF